MCIAKALAVRQAKDAAVCQKPRVRHCALFKVGNFREGVHMLLPQGIVSYVVWRLRCKSRNKNMMNDA